MRSVRRHQKASFFVMSAMSRTKLCDAPARVRTVDTGIVSATVRRSEISAKSAEPQISRESPQSRRRLTAPREHHRQSAFYPLDVTLTDLAESDLEFYVRMPPTAMKLPKQFALGGQRRILGGTRWLLNAAQCLSRTRYSAAGTQATPQLGRT